MRPGELDAVEMASILKKPFQTGMGLIGSELG
jgi:hypothetical protein